MKNLAIVICCTALAAGCVHNVTLESGEEISFPRNARVARIKAQSGMHVVQPGMSRDGGDGYISLEKLTQSGTVVIVDEQPKYDYAHGFAVYFIPDETPKNIKMIFRGDSFPIGLVNKSEWKKMSNQ